MPHRDDQERQITTLFQRYGPLVYRRCLKILGNAALAEEAMQDIFIRVIKGIEQFDGRSQLSSWLFRITTNHCLNSIRDAQRRRELWQENVVPIHANEVSKDDPVTTLLTRQLLAEANPQEAQAAVCVYMEGMTGAETAAVLGVSRRTVTNLLERFKTWALERYEELDETRPPPHPPPGSS